MVKREIEMVNVNGDEELASKATECKRKQVNANFKICMQT